MVCKRCGKSVQGDPARCPHCATLLKESVSLGAVGHTAPTKRRKKKKKLSGVDLALRVALIVVSVIAVLAILAGVAYLLILNWMDNQRDDGDTKFNEVEQGELNINTALPTKDIQNIALFGLDERGETDATVDGLGNGKGFHSDAIIILTVDRRDPNNPKVKMSSIARDTLVYVEGYSSKGSLTKITNAFDYGYRKAKRADSKRKLTEADYKREGAKTAIKTLNQNFNMNITEYMYVNFVEFMDIIDHIGGITMDVSFPKGKETSGLNELNKHVKWMEKECNRDIERVTSTGVQTLTGGQALAYARVRKIDSDIYRTNRQREVLKAVFEKVKGMPLTKLPDLAGKLLGMCHTTLTSEEIVEMAVWAVSKSPEIINYTLPDTSVKGWIWEGTHPDYNWVWIYDLNYATYLLHDFIYDTDTAKDHPKPTMPNAPKVTNSNTTTTHSDLPPVTGVPTITDTPIGTGDPTDTWDPTATGDPTGSFDPTATGDPSVTGDPTAPIDPTGTGESSSTDVVAPTEPTEPTAPIGGDTTAPTVDVPVTTTTTEFVAP